MHRSSVGFAVLSFFALAAPAHGAEVTLWACHGPSGGPLGSAAIAATGSPSGSCDAPGTALRADSLRLTVPADLVSVSYDRRSTGPGYRVTAGGELERLDAATTIDGVFSAPAGGRDLLLAGTAIDLRSAALTVSDSTPPSAQVTVPNRASGTLPIAVRAADEGVGLATVTATLDGEPAASAAFGVCAELSPADATIDRALGGDCPATATRTLAIDTTKFANGEHDLLIRTTDAAGLEQDVLWGLKIENEAPPAASSAEPTATATAEPTATATAAPIVQGPHTRAPTPTPVLTPAGGTLGDHVTRYGTRDFLRVPSRPRVARAGTLTLTARCPLPKPCALRVKLTRAGTTLAGGRVTVRPKQTARLRLKLTRAALASLERRSPQDMRLSVAGYPSVAITVR